MATPHAATSQQRYHLCVHAALAGNNLTSCCHHKVGRSQQQTGSKNGNQGHRDPQRRASVAAPTATVASSCRRGSALHDAGAQQVCGAEARTTADSTQHCAAGVLQWVREHVRDQSPAVDGDVRRGRLAALAVIAAAAMQTGAVST